MQYIFDSLKVVELANVLAGPSVGQFFAELGASVIKVENPTTNGDVTRGWRLKTESNIDTVSAYFSSVNSGKQSIALDVLETHQKNKLLKLIEAADVLISSYKPGDAERLGLSYEHLKRKNPKLIYAAITGYGSNTPRVGYDAILQAETGFMYLNGQPNGDSLKMPVALIDVLAAHHLKEAILLAYIHRLKTGEGSHVSVSLFDAAVSSLVNQATNYLIAGFNPKKMGAEHPNIAPYGKLYTCADKVQIILAIGSDKQFVSLCKVLGIEEMSVDLRFSTNARRVENREELNAMLSKAICKQESNNLLNQLNRFKVPAGRLNDIATLFSSKQAQDLCIKTDNKVVGLRTFAAELSFQEKIPHIAPPPSFNSSESDF